MVVASLKILQQQYFSAFFEKQASTAISAFRKSVGPRSPQPPALRVEVTALALRKRQGFLLLFLFLPISPYSGGGLLDRCFHTLPQMAYSGSLSCGGGPPHCPAW